MLKAFIDRIEGNVAVLITDSGDEFQLPVEALAPGVGEGETVYVSVTGDAQMTADANADVASIQDRLRNKS